MFTAAISKKRCLVRTALLVLLPGAAAAQEADVVRRTYTFLDDRIMIAVEAEAPGVLRVIRGEGGRLEVAGRAHGGFVGFGLAGEPTQQLRLDAVGGDRVEYLVVVPERVRVTVRLPKGGGELGSTQTSALYRWGDEAGATADTELLPTAGGLYVLHSNQRTPSLVDLPRLTSVRSISVRFEGELFRIAASRPLSLTGTATTAFVLEISGPPTDIVIHVPRHAGAFTLRAADQHLVQSSGGQPTTSCNQVLVQQPTGQQAWFTIYPQGGKVSCR
jgi:hypothetical protein